MPDEIEKTNFPPNSHRSRENRDEPKKMDKVITGKVITKKKSFCKKVIETFVGDEVNDVGSYLLNDILIPAAKSTMSDMFHSAIDMIIPGERSRNNSNRSRRDFGRTYISYDRFSSSDRDRKDYRRELSYRDRAAHNFDDIILSSRGEAERVLNDLVDLIIDYDEATVAALYDLVGITSSFTDTKYGWKDLSSSKIKPVREGYLLILPKPILLN